jgi:predicted hydrolase (HD superfamily)
MTTTQAVTAENAWKLVDEYTSSPLLKRHMLSVSTAMKAYATKFGEDPVRWEVAGILHDFDFERFPDEHPHSNRRLLLEFRWPPDLVDDIYSHGDVGLPRDTPIRKTIYAVDELCGFIIACALVKPDKSLSAVDASTVRKKMKDKAFARAVHRDQLLEGAEQLGVPFDEHVVNVRDALIPIAAELGLNP